MVPECSTDMRYMNELESPGKATFDEKQTLPAVSDHGSHPAMHITNKPSRDDRLTPGKDLKLLDYSFIAEKDGFECLFRLLIAASN